jgi:ATP-dependent helicase/nuclease subunit B
VSGGHLVIDYNLGRAPGAKLREAGKTELQLPVYAAAVKRALGGEHVDAAYVSLRDGGPSRTLGAALGVPQAAALIDEELPRRVQELGARLRTGAFEVAPADEQRCLWCAVKVACRVVRRQREEDEAA